MRQSPGDLNTAVWHFRSGSLDSAGGLLLETITASPLIGTTVFTQTPQGAGNYNISANSLIGGTSSYTFTFTLRPTAAVPEPATMLLVGLGAFDIGVNRRLTRRR